jgi:hypothetical protein
MFYKKIVPIKILNSFALYFICEFFIDDLNSSTIEIEFYDDEGHPLLSRKINVSELPVDEELIEGKNIHNFNYSGDREQEMFNKQNKIIFDKIKTLFGLSYYDDNYEIENEKKFSYIQYFKLPDAIVGKSFSITK